MDLRDNFKRADVCERAGRVPALFCGAPRKKSAKRYGTDPAVAYFQHTLEFGELEESNRSLACSVLPPGVIQVRNPVSAGVREGATVAEQRNRYLSKQESSDLGFGSVVSNQPQLRLLNRDGSFNVVRPRSQRLRNFSGYHRLLTISWPRFFLLVLLVYVGINVVFAEAYYLLGPQALVGNIQTSNFVRAFFFSIHSFATIGYGNIVPVGVMANLLVAFEALVGLVGLAVITGMVFARFSRPVADIVFSRNAVVAPYRDITGFEFRVVNARENQLIELHATVVFSRFEKADGRFLRIFTPLPLERESVSFFPLNWTVVHPIDEQSPLFGWTEERLIESNAEFLILLTAIDETFAQTVHSRSSYSADEVLWNARFAPMYRKVEGVLELDISRLHAVTPVSSQAAADD